MFFPTIIAVRRTLFEMKCTFDLFSGYGCSSGKATERNIYADMRCAYEVLQSRYNVQPEKVKGTSKAFF